MVFEPAGLDRKCMIVNYLFGVFNFDLITVSSDQMF